MDNIKISTKPKLYRQQNLVSDLNINNNKEETPSTTTTSSNYLTPFAVKILNSNYYCIGSFRRTANRRHGFALRREFSKSHEVFFFFLNYSKCCLDRSMFIINVTKKKR